MSAAASIVFFLTGNTAWGFQVLALTGVLQLLRRLLEPKLMSNNIGISPLLSLIGMFVGMRLGGILGLIGGIVGAAVLRIFGIQGQGILGGTLVSVVGACILIWLGKRL